MKTSRELFQLVKEKFRYRHNNKPTVSSYYDSERYPLGCAIGCLLPKEDRKSLQHACSTGKLPYSIGDILKNEEVFEIRGLRGYSVHALRLLQSLHDNSGSVGEFKDNVNRALTTGVATAHGFSDLYLDEEPTNDDI